MIIIQTYLTINSLEHIDGHISPNMFCLARKSDRLRGRGQGVGVPGIHWIHWTYPQFENSIPTHLKNMTSSVGMMKFPIWKNPSSKLSKPPTSSFGIYKGSIFQGECNCWAAHPPLNLTVNPDLVAIKFTLW